VVYRIDFEWDQAKAGSNAVKHGVAFEDAMMVFRDPLALSRFDEDHSADEERWITLGVASPGNLLLVVHTWTEIDADHARVRIISARHATRKEGRQYHEDPML
jgi:uncharacterized DUF497 family protein